MSENSCRILVSRCEPFSAVRGRHPDVDDGQVRKVLADQVQQLRGIARLTDHLEAGPLEQADNPLADQHIVVGHDNTAATHSRVFDVLFDPAFACCNHHVYDLRRRGSSLKAGTRGERGDQDATWRARATRVTIQQGYRDTIAPQLLVRAAHLMRVIGRRSQVRPTNDSLSGTAKLGRTA